MSGAYVGRGVRGTPQPADLVLSSAARWPRTAFREMSQLDIREWEASEQISSKPTSGQLRGRQPHPRRSTRNDGTSHWREAGEGLPTVLTPYLQILADRRVLFAGTHGRGAWYLTLP